MNVLLDTNVLVRAADPADKDHRVAVDAVAQLRLNGDELHLVPQNFFEFWVVSTREVSKNGRGKSPADVVAELAFFHAQFKVLDDSRSLLLEWERLVGSANVIGKAAHDARLVAAMHVHQLTHLLTFNDRDFQRFATVTILNPATIVKSSP